MRYNAHFIQSNKGVANLGSGTESSYVLWTATQYVKDGAKPSADVLSSETRFRRLYVDRVFCSGYDGANYRYNQFFSGSDPIVYPNELMTAGQVSDYVTNASNGVMPLWVGNHFTDTIIRNLWSSGAPVLEDWYEYSLYDKMKSILVDLLSESKKITAVSAVTIKADNFEGTTAGVDVNAVNLGAGRASTGVSDDIFTVTGGADGSKRIDIITGVNTGKPSGIAGSYNDSTYADYSATEHSFVDVGRYYLRDGDEKGLLFDSKLSYLSASVSGAFFQLGNNSVTIPRTPGVNTRVIVSQGASDQIITLNNSRYLYLGLTNTTSGLIFNKLSSPTSYWITRVNASKRLTFTDDSNHTILLRLTTPSYADDYHFLTSNAGEVMYGADPDTGTMIPFIDFKYQPEADQMVSIGMARATNNNESRFYVRQYNESDYKNCIVPVMGFSSEFIVTNPYSVQTISKGLIISGATGTLTVDAETGSSTAIALSGNAETRIKYGNVGLYLTSTYSSIYGLSGNDIQVKSTGIELNGFTTIGDSAPFGSPGASMAPIKTFFFSGTLDGSGAYIITSGIDESKIIAASVSCENSGGGYDVGYYFRVRAYDDAGTKKISIQATHENFYSQDFKLYVTYTE